MRQKLRRPSTGTILGFLALGVALGGTAFAATGQLVNIADPANSAYVARVDSAGNLRTIATQASSKAFDATASISNYNTSGSYGAVLSTTATLGVTSMSFTNSVYNDSAWEAYAYYSPDSDGGACPPSPFVTGNRNLMKVSVPAGGTTVLPLPTPILLRSATSGQQYCLEVGAAPRAGAGGANSTPLQV